MAVLDVLRNVELFKGLNDDELRNIAESGSLKTFAKGDIIFEENSEGKEFFVVTGGCVAINKNVAGGRKRNLSNLRQGDIFGEIALFDSQPRSADAEAVTDSEVVVFPNDKFRTMLKRNLVIAFIIQTRIIRVLCKRLRETDEMLKEGVIWGFKMDV